MLLIDKEALVLDVMDASNADEALAMIDDAPTIDAVPVVRCWECMYSASIVDEITHESNGLWCALLDLENVEEDFYCKDGDT